MLARYMLLSRVRLSVRSSQAQAGVVSKRLDTELVLARELPLTYPKLYYKEIQVHVSSVL